MPQPEPIHIIPNLLFCEGKDHYTRHNNLNNSTLICSCDSVACHKECLNCPCGSNCNPNDNCNCNKNVISCPECVHGCDEYGKCLCLGNCKNGCTVSGKCIEIEKECLNKYCTECSGDHREICHKCTNVRNLITESDISCKELDPES